MYTMLLHSCRMSKFVQSKWETLSTNSNGGASAIYEPDREKTGFLPRRKQRRRSASR